MDDKNTEFMFDISDDFTNALSKKFPEGKKQHGGDIWNIPALKLVKEAKAEALDQYTYLYTLEVVMKQLLADPVIKKRVKELYK